MIWSRVEKKDPDAIYFLGAKYYYGELGLQKNLQRAVELYTEAAELGSIDALFSLGSTYYRGNGIEQDKVKGIQLWTKAAMQGHVQSRHNLGGCENQKRRYNRAVRHLLISAKVGDKRSLESIKKMYMAGLATKEQYSRALKGYQDAVEEMKSHDRDEAKRLGY